MMGSLGLMTDFFKCHSLRDRINPVDVLYKWIVVKDHESEELIPIMIKKISGEWIIDVCKHQEYCGERLFDRYPNAKIDD